MQQKAPRQEEFPALPPKTEKEMVDKDATAGAEGAKAAELSGGKPDGRSWADQVEEAKAQPKV